MGDFQASLSPALPLPVPVMGVLTLLVADLEVTLDHSNAGTELTQDGERRIGHTLEATSLCNHESNFGPLPPMAQTAQSLVMALG